MKKRKLFKQRCGAPTTWLLSCPVVGLEKYLIPPVTKVPSPLKANKNVCNIVIYLYS
jgi:hypothetical protein